MITFHIVMGDDMWAEDERKTGGGRMKRYSIYIKSVYIYQLIT